ncbi:MAG: hypothetical protein IPJ07_09495 [Acidobacteria bacterium]|nr:hypothetical protein [Acidobacteriota bacterium]
MNKELLFLASPWSPPGRMKTTGSLIGGSLLPQWYATYADYFVKFLKGYDDGCASYAVTVQNEPGVDRAKEKDLRWHYPLMPLEIMNATSSATTWDRRAGLKTRIWCYDHNYNVSPKDDDPGIDYPRTILSDARAARFVDGVAFHVYAGLPDGMSTFHSQFPKTRFTSPKGRSLEYVEAVSWIDRLRNHASSYNAWVTICSTITETEQWPLSRRQNNSLTQSSLT